MSTSAGGPSAASPRVVYLHIGAPKTGTTYLQAMLHAHRAQLRRDGCLYPRTRLPAHHDEARDLRNVRPGGYLHPRVPGSWKRLVSAVHAWEDPGVVVISSELLTFATAPQARRAVESLQPAEVHLVLTLRDLVRQVPAVWQEMVKNRSDMTYAEFLRRLDQEDPGAERRLLGGQDPERILARWGATIPPERVHVVTVPPRGADPGLLWARFAQVLGIDPDRYPAVETTANTSLGVAETEVVRRLNEHLQGSPWPFFAKHVKNGIAQGVLTGRSGTRLVLPESALPMVEQRSKDAVTWLSGQGLDVVGDLDDLLARSDHQGVGPMPQADPAELAESFAIAAEYLVAEFAESTRRPAPVASEGGGRKIGLRERLVSLSERHSSVDVLRRAYRKGRDRLAR